MPNQTSRISSSYNLGHGTNHVYKNVGMLLETLFILIGFCGITIWSHHQSIDSVLWISMFLQGCWMP